MERKLPVGIQNFEEIRKQGYLYVDKTAYIYQLVNTGKVYFLSRPRRFGKSLLVSTMDAFFSGKSDLFNGLAIEKLENQSPTYLNEDGQRVPWVKGPVIHLDFNNVSSETVEAVRNSLSEKLSKYESVWGKEEGDLTIAGRFLSLIENMHEKTGIPVAVLVDEYDKPLLNTFENQELNQKIRELLKTFFGTLKTADAHTRFVFITGVTKFSHVSIFSDLNQLKDISMRKEFNEICGMTAEEISNVFDDEIIVLGNILNFSKKEIIYKLAEWYDGYKFCDNVKGIFNPFSVLNTLDAKKFGNYWSHTATPTFLVKALQLADFNIPDMSEGIEAEEEMFTMYRSSMDEPLPLLYQSGYLTIKSYNSLDQTYMLGFPNYEVESGFLKFLLPMYFQNDASGSNGISSVAFSRAVRSGNIDEFIEKLKSLLASVPYDDSRLPEKLTSYENTYRNAVFLIFSLCGLDLKPEVHMSNGRSDAVLETKTHVYIFEFKMKKNGTADDAIRQIEENGYDVPYRSLGKKIIKIGIVFDPEIRNISEYKAVAF